MTFCQKFKVRANLRRHGFKILTNHKEYKPIKSTHNSFEYATHETTIKVLDYLCSNYTIKCEVKLTQVCSL